MSTTPQMGLVLPVPSSTTPDWAGLLNTAFNLIDTHDHTAGHGIPVPSAGIGINADLPFNGFNLTQARTLRLQQQGSAPALAADAGAIYVTTAGDLWFNNGAGQHVQITSGSALSAASLGGISGLGGTSAGVAFNNATKTFTFTQAATQAALLDAGPLVIRDTAASAFGITLQSPVGIAGAYTLTLPTALPASNALLSIGTSGVLTAFGTVSGSALALVGTLTLGASAPPAAASLLNLISAGQVTANFTSTGGSSGNQRGQLVYDAGGAFGVPAWVFQNATDAGAFVANGLIIRRDGLLQLGVQATPIQPASIITTPSVYTGWTVGHGFGYWKDANGIVHLKGQLTKTSAVVSSAFNLPVGFRPAGASALDDLFLPALGAGAGSNIAIRVLTTTANGAIGDVQPVSTATGTYYFDGVSFLAEA